MPQPRPVESLLAPLLAGLALVGCPGSLRAQDPCQEFPELVELRDPLSEAGEWFGAAVAIDGGVAVVGVPRDRADGYGTGRALVHEWGPGGWTLTARLRDDVVRSLTHFGNAVDVEGDLIAVGAYVDDEAAPDAGAVHLFRRQPDGSWLRVQRLEASDAARTDLFGSSVALDGTLLAIGAREDKNPSVPLTHSGSVYLFEDDGTGHFVETDRVAAPAPQGEAWFGYAVALDEGVLVVGEPRRDQGSRAHAGSAHVFARQADGSWAWEAELATLDQEASAQYGLDVEIEGGLVVVGRDHSGPVRSWRRLGPGSWAVEGEVSPSDPRVQDFGTGVALSAGRLFVGASHSRRTLAGFSYVSDGLGGWSLVDEFAPDDMTAGRSRSLDFDGDHLILGDAGHVHEGLASGGAWLFGCNPPPSCDAGPPSLSADCDGLRLSGSAEDPAGRSLSAWWSSDCPDLIFSPAADRLDPLVLLDEVCERECVLNLEVTADDGATCSDSLLLSIDDDRPPELTVPPPLGLECSGLGGVPASDPRVVAWLASASAADACRSVTMTTDAPAFLPAGCAPGQATRVRFLARDDCGNETVAESEILVVDSTPPFIEPGSEVLAELWSPSHRPQTLAAASLSPTISDLCDSGPAAWSLARCVSSEPEDGRGDGSSEPDCAIAPDGQSVALRAERSGRGEGRLYELSIIATDACGNSSAPVAIGSVRVRHDQRR